MSARCDVVFESCASGMTTFRIIQSGTKVFAHVVLQENAFKMLFIAAIYLLIYNFLSILTRSRKNFLYTNFVNVLTMYKKNLEFSNFFDSMENLFCEDEVKLLKIIIIILEKYIFIQE